MLFFQVFYVFVSLFSRCYVVWSVYISLSLRLVCYKSWWRVTQLAQNVDFLSINCIPCKKRTCQNHQHVAPPQKMFSRASSRCQRFDDHVNGWNSTLQSFIKAIHHRDFQGRGRNHKLTECTQDNPTRWKESILQIETDCWSSDHHAEKWFASRPWTADVGVDKSSR